jgi:hypothetical protein
MPVITLGTGIFIPMQLVHTREHMRKASTAGQSIAPIIAPCDTCMDISTTTIRERATTIMSGVGTSLDRVCRNVTAPSFARGLPAATSRRMP